MDAQMTFIITLGVTKRAKRGRLCCTSAVFSVTHTCDGRYSSNFGIHLFLGRTNTTTYAKIFKKYNNNNKNDLNNIALYKNSRLACALCLFLGLCLQRCWMSTWCMKTSVMWCFIKKKYWNKISCKIWFIHNLILHSLFTTGISNKCHWHHASCLTNMDKDAQRWSKRDGGRYVTIMYIERAWNRKCRF